MPILTRSQTLLLGVALAVAFIIALFPVFPGQLRVQEGDVASRTIRAPRNLSFESDLLTEQARDATEQSVPEVLTFDPNVRTEQLLRLTNATDEITRIRDDAGASEAAKRARVLAVEGLGGLSRTSIDVLLGLPDAAWARVAGESSAVLERVLTESIGRAVLEETRSGVESEISLDLTAGESGVAADLVRGFIEATLLVDSEATARAREAARENVEPVRQTIARNQVIVTEGSRIDGATAEVLEHAGLLTSVVEWDRLGAVIVVSMIGAIMLASYATLFPVRSLASTRRLVLLAVLIAAPVLAAKLYLSLVLPDEGGRFLMYFLPVAAAPMLVAALLDARLAMLVALVQGALIAFAAAYLPEHAFFTALEPIDVAGLLLVYGLGSVLGALAAFRAERPNQYVLGGVLLSTVVFASLFSLWLLDGAREPVDLFWMTMAAGLSGLGSGLMTAGGLAAMGSIMGVTTRLQLMELAQLNSPLLRRLQDEAPGTFHHSVIVANLAERAADLIGADSLLVRVGCYYHDIGKMLQPGYYVENQLGGDNPHEGMGPELSARIIKQHVSNGLDLARRYGLPGRVQSFIPQHHGTRLVPYFYRMASEGGTAVNEEAYRYAGPKPQTKETAIVMLADSTEAMVRSSADRSSERIDTIVEEVLAERLAEGELEECDLTLRDLRTVAGSFKLTLRGVYHPRIEYPEPTQRERQALIGRFRPGRGRASSTPSGASGSGLDVRSSKFDRPP